MFSWNATDILRSRVAAVAPPADDADVASFRSLVTAAGEDVSASEYSRLNTLATTLKAQGVWGRIFMLWVPVGGSLAVARRCLKSPLGTGYRMGSAVFLESEWNRSVGLDGRLMNGRQLVTGLIGNDIVFNDSHMSIHIEPPANDALNRRDMGVFSSNSTQINVFDSEGIYRSANTTIGLENIPLSPNTLGLMVGTRQSSDARFYQNGNLRSQVTTAATNVASTQQIRIFRARTDQSGKVMSAASIGLGLTNQQVLDYSTAMAAFRAARI